MHLSLGRYTALPRFALVSCKAKRSNFCTRRATCSLSFCAFGRSKGDPGVLRAEATVEGKNNEVPRRNHHCFIPGERAVPMVVYYVYESRWAPPTLRVFVSAIDFRLRCFFSFPDSTRLRRRATCCCRCWWWWRHPLSYQELTRPRSERASRPSCPQGPLRRTTARRYSLPLSIPKGGEHRLLDNRAHRGSRGTKT